MRRASNCWAPGRLFVLAGALTVCAAVPRLDSQYELVSLWGKMETRMKSLNRESKNEEEQRQVIQLPRVGVSTFDSIRSLVQLLQ